MTLEDADVELFDCEHKTPTAATRGIPYIAIPEMKGGRLDVSKARLVAEQDIPIWNRRVTPEEGDVILSRRTNPGVTAVVPANLRCVLGQNLVILRSRGTKVEQRFLRWLTRSSEWWQQIAKNLNVGAVFDSLRCADIPRFELTIPPLQEQRVIAHILSTLDDKIDLNRQMSETLEAMARAIFKSWFVDFDPVRAKAEGRDPGLPKPLAGLFPDRLEDSELGEIPTGWEVLSLDQIARFLNGLALQKYPAEDHRSLPVIKIAQLRAGNTDGADLASADLEPEYVVKDGDVLFSWSGSLECVLWAGGAGALNQHLFKVTSAQYPKWLCYLGVHRHLDDFRHIAAGKATTMGHIQRHHLSDAKLAVPMPELLRAMDVRFAPMIESIWELKVQSKTLAALRDALLPKLISGELRGGAAEKLVVAEIP